MRFNHSHSDSSIVTTMFGRIYLLATLPYLLAVRQDNFNNNNGPQTFGGGNVRHAPVVRYSEADAPRAPPPAIITHKQGLSNEGVFNYVFAADNGLKQGESIAPDGTRTGAYEYIDPNGKTIFVKYTAGKDGFKILEGDHIPLQPQKVEPIDEFQSPEHRKDFKAKEQGKYQAEVEDYDGQYRGGQQQQQQQYQQPKNQQNQRYTQPQQPQQFLQEVKPQQQLFQPSIQQKGQQGQFGGQQGQFGRQQVQLGAQQGKAPFDGNRASYNVEQRHNANYRRYQDNGQPTGGSGDDQSGTPHTFGGGYNFEFKG